MKSINEAVLEQALLTVLSLNEDAGLNLDGVITDVRRSLSKEGKYRHYCTGNANSVCEEVERLVNKVKKLKSAH